MSNFWNALGSLYFTLARCIHWIWIVACVAAVIIPTIVLSLVELLVVIVVGLVWLIGYTPLWLISAVGYTIFPAKKAARDDARSKLKEWFDNYVS